MSLIPDDFLIDIFGNYKPGIGSIFVEKSRQDRTNDIKLAKYLKKKYGGNYIVLSDITPQGVKVPDLFLYGKAFFENKNVTNLNSLDSQIRRALYQLDRNNLKRIHPSFGNCKLRHVIVIHIEDNTDLTDENIIKTVKHRIKRYSVKNTPYIDYLIVRKNGRIKFIWKHQKTP